jgi:hypothetical protein
VNSSGNGEFWRLYRRLPGHVRGQARQAYRLFLSNPDHPSLRFKKLSGPRNFWSVRFGGGYRAVCERDGENVVWLWVGTRQEFGKKF